MLIVAVPQASLEVFCMDEISFSWVFFWQVSDGRSISLWDDPWISQTSSFKLVSQPIVLPCDALVSTLINPNTHTWNWGLASYVLLPLEVERLKFILEFLIQTGSIGMVL